MYKDEIIAEVWRNRDAYARKHHNNLDEIVADLRKREKSHPDRIVNRRFHRTASNLQKQTALRLTSDVEAQGAMSPPCLPYRSRYSPGNRPLHIAAYTGLLEAIRIGPTTQKYCLTLRNAMSNIALSMMRVCGLFLPRRRCILETLGINAGIRSCKIHI